MSRDEALAAVWRHQAEWSAAAGKLKSRHVRWRTVVLGALVIGAAMGALALQFESGSAGQRGIALVSAVVLGLVPVIRASRISKEGVLQWTRARSVSEALKHEVFVYVTETGRYRQAPTRSTELLDATSVLLEKVKDLEPWAAIVNAAERPVPEPLSLGDYLDARVKKQIETYYRPKASIQARRLKTAQTLEFFLALSAAALSAAALSGWSTGVEWVGAIAASAGAVTAYREAARYEQQVISFRATATRLEALRAQWLQRIAGPPLSIAEEDRLVAECEDAISVENQSWMAGWTDAPNPS